MGADRLVVGLSGFWPTHQEKAWLQKWQPFGVILFSRNISHGSQLKKLCSYLCGLVPNLQLMADHEGGPVSQLAAALGRPPAAWTLGSLDDEDLTCRVHQRTARIMAEAGVTWVLAPCADVMTNPHNPVIGVRAFGNQSDIVSRHVRAAVEGLITGGVQVCLKHWPGHGSAGQDSHLQRAFVADDSKAEAVIPFHAGMVAGASAVMVGHLCSEESLRNKSPIPATLDAGFLKASRKELAGNNDTELLLVADDITMGGLREPMAGLGVTLAKDGGTGLVEPADLPLEWFEALESAGCDLLLIRGLPLGAFPVGLQVSDDVREEVTQHPVSFPSTPEYEEARARASVAGDFFCRGEVVLWVDLTIGDRWAVAAGTKFGQQGQIGEVLANGFKDVNKVIGGEIRSGGVNTYSRVVLVSHRPLHWNKDDIPLWMGKLAQKGQIVVMGHPSLEEDFFNALPDDLKPNWLITPLFDVTGGDLRP